MKLIYLLVQRSSDYESVPYTIKAFESKETAEFYQLKFHTVFNNLYSFYSEMIENPSLDELMDMSEEEWEKYDILSTKRNKYQGMNFYIEEIPLTAQKEQTENKNWLELMQWLMPKLSIDALISKGKSAEKNLDLVAHHLIAYTNELMSRFNLTKK